MDLLELAEGHASTVLRKSNLDGDDAPDAFLAAQGAGVTVMLVEPKQLGREKARFVGGDESEPSLIRISDSLPLALQHAYLAHELGHEIAFRQRNQLMLGNA